MKNLIVIATLTALVPFAALAQDTPGSHFIANWDLDASGAVTVAEVVERREMVFNMFDNDQNGMLDAAEYVMFDETRAADMDNNADGHGKGGDRMQVGLTLAFNDTNQDGAVSLDEFIANSAAWVAQVDRDGDGAITSGDFGPQGN
ncbi:EF-hand domain-containing protein [Yoonia vestfoldensis]|uniref:EF-hand domain-containing protein n=1 Tax=Yoonia vestfoldensis TaxID=245188 RepID=UPI00035C293A|nr:EF-hand domain-containing protein [Yoonia vestfoldensis]